MLQFIGQIICYVVLTALLFTFSLASSGRRVRVKDSVGIERTIRFRRGENSATVSGQIRPGQAHWYHVRARAGQQMAVVLKTGNSTSFTIFGQKSGILEGADGVRQTVVELPDSGDYLIEIGTDATANYTLEVTIN